MKVLGKRVLIKPDPIPETNESGIYVGASNMPNYHTGEVLDVGRLVKDIKKGDRVLWTKFSGTKIQHEGDELFLMLGDNIEAKIS